MKVIEESGKVGLKINIQKTKIMASGPNTSWQIDRETMETGRLYFLGLQNHCRRWLQPWNEKTLAPWKKSYDQPRKHMEKRHYFANKGPSSQSYGFSWRRKWQPTPVFLLGESQGQRSLVGCCLWGCTESDTTERLSSSSSIVFLAVMYECESWTIKKAECRRIDAFELWCWRRLLRVLWTARKSN